MLRKFLLDLVKICAPSGYEQPVADYIVKNIKNYVDEVNLDEMGNVIAVKKGSGTGNLKLMIMAHLDEVSMVVKDVDEYVWFENVGWINKDVLMGTPVKIIKPTQEINGVICSKSAHFEQEKAEEFWIDVGNHQEEVEVGDPVTFSPNCRWLDRDRNILASKSVDDRIGCAILLELARRLEGKELNCDIYFIGTVREEVGSQGAAYVSSRLQADYLIALDTAFARDAEPDRNKTVGLNEGPVLRRFQMTQPSGQLYPAKILYSDRKLDQLISDSADKLGIPLNPDIYAGTFTDTTLASEVKPELSCSTLMIPRRYSHSPGEVVNVKNADYAADILTHLLENLSFKP